MVGVGVVFPAAVEGGRVWAAKAMEVTLLTEGVALMGQLWASSKSQCPG